MLFCLRGLSNRTAWNDGFLKAAFWMLNIGLAGMAFMSLLPVGALQAWASVSKGLWYARSAEFLHQPLIETLVWLRVPGDSIFAVGAFALALFGAKLWFGRKAGTAGAGQRAGAAQPAE
jgi:nitric oxide reductase subunit B